MVARGIENDAGEKAEAGRDAERCREGPHSGGPASDEVRLVALVDSDTARRGVGPALGCRAAASGGWEVDAAIRDATVMCPAVAEEAFRGPARFCESPWPTQPRKPRRSCAVARRAVCCRRPHAPLFPNRSGCMRCLDRAFWRVRRIDVREECRPVAHTLRLCLPQRWFRGRPAHAGYPLAGRAFLAVR